MNKVEMVIMKLEALEEELNKYYESKLSQKSLIAKDEKIEHYAQNLCKKENDMYFTIGNFTKVVKLQNGQVQIRKNGAYNYTINFIIEEDIGVTEIVATDEEIKRLPEKIKKTIDVSLITKESMQKALNKCKIIDLINEFIHEFIDK